MMKSLLTIWYSEELNRESRCYTASVADNYHVNLNTLGIRHTLLCINVERDALLIPSSIYVTDKNQLNVRRKEKIQQVVNSASQMPACLQ